MQKGREIQEGTYVYLKTLQNPGNNCKNGIKWLTWKANFCNSFSTTLRIGLMWISYLIFMSIMLKNYHKDFFTDFEKRAVETLV